MSGRSSSALGCDLGELAVLGAQLRGGLDLDPLGLLERALRERREPGEALDLDVEQLAADGALLGRRIDVEDVAADRELAALLDLVDALVAAGDELVERLREVERAALARSRTRAGEDPGSGTFSLSAVAEAHHGGGPGIDERIQRSDAEADQVRRRARG